MEGSGDIEQIPTAIFRHDLVLFCMEKAVQADNVKG